MSAKLKYRPEIDGLRAVAVLAVILFHAGIPGLSGGFVGVDVFFVISGYLITGILLREMEAGNFSIINFYDRRIRRILPALFLVLLVTIPFAWFLMNPYAFGRFGQGLVAVTAFVSNILYWKTTNYFTETAGNPLLHTWSLGVEEQFYIFFPLFLLLVWRYGRKWVGTAFVLAALLSLALSQWSVSNGSTVAAFYLSPLRAFELLAGSLVALGAFRDRLPKLSPLGSGTLAWTGMGLIFCAFATFDQSTPFPGWRALLPSVGTALILAFIRVESLLGRLLSLRLMVLIGLVSYSAYLWHQPIFTFVYIVGYEPGLLENLGLATASVVLAWVSWKYVEAPFRDRKRMTRRTVFRWAAISSVAMIGFGAWVAATGGVSQRFTPEEVRWWQYTDVRNQSQYVLERFGACNGEFSDAPGRKVLIIGDSYAQDFVNMVHEAGAWTDAEIRTIYVPLECQMVLVEEDVRGHIPRNKWTMCDKSPSIASSLAQIHQADIVVMASKWQNWSAGLLPRTIANMDLRPEQQLFVLGTKEFGKANIRELIALGEQGRAQARHTVEGSFSEADRIMRESLPPTIFVDAIRLMGGPGEQCPVVTDRDGLISFDGEHLTREGAEYLGNLLFSRSVLAGAR